MSASRLTWPNLPFIHEDIRASMIVQCGGARSPFHFIVSVYVNIKYNIAEKCHNKNYIKMAT